MKRSGWLGTELIYGGSQCLSWERVLSFTLCPALAVTPTWECPVSLFQQVTFGRAGVGCPGKMRIPVFPVKESCSLQSSCLGNPV